jgi:hypothetical protein
MLPFGFGWMVFACAVLPGMFQATFFRGTLKAVLILDPVAERSADLLLNRACASMMVAGAPWGISMWLLAVAKTQSEVNTLKLVMAISVCIVTATSSIACTRVYALVSLSHQPASALAYAEVFPEHKKNLAKIGKLTMSIAVLYGAISVAAIPVWFLLGRRYFYTIGCAFALSSEQVFLYMGYSCKNHHQLPTAASAVQQLPSNRRSTVDWTSSLISEVTGAFCSDINSNVVLQFANKQEEQNAQSVPAAGDQKAGITDDNTRRRVSHLKTTPRSFTPPHASEAQRGVSLQFLKVLGLNMHNAQCHAVKFLKSDPLTFIHIRVMDKTIDSIYIDLCEQSSYNYKYLHIKYLHIKCLCKFASLFIPTLKQFVSEFGVEKAETTHSVVARLVKKHTEPVSRAYHSMLGRGWDKYGRPWCGDQSVFVSHSWGSPFDTLVQVVTEFERKNPNRRGTYYFIDIFVMNQHSIDTEKDKNDDSVYRKLLASLDDSLRASDMILVVLNQYAAPEALTRIWCKLSHKVLLVLVLVYMRRRVHANVLELLTTTQYTYV